MDRLLSSADQIISLKITYACASVIVTPKKIYKKKRIRKTKKKYQKKRMKENRLGCAET